MSKDAAVSSNNQTSKNFMSIATYNNDKDKNEEGKLVDRKDEQRSSFLLPNLKKVLRADKVALGGSQIKYMPEK